jgi:hypothetical protein
MDKVRPGTLDPSGSGLWEAATGATLSHETKDAAMPPIGPSPIGPEVDANPCLLPAGIPVRGRYVTLEPLYRRHIGTDGSWTNLGSGPVAANEALPGAVKDRSAMHHPEWAAWRSTLRSYQDGSPQMRDAGA